MAFQPIGDWTADRIERLKKLYAAGMTGSQIAADLGGVTRNAVIGKIHRLGLELRGKKISTGPKAARRRPKGAHNIIPTSWGAGHRQFAEPSPIDFIDVVLDPLNISFADIRDHQCKSITNNDMTAPLYCGRFVSEGSHYCAPHRRLYYHAGKRQGARAASLVLA